MIGVEKVPSGNVDRVRQAMRLPSYIAGSSSEPPSNTTIIAVVAAFGSVLFLWGLAIRAVAGGDRRANDTRGPRWVRTSACTGPTRPRRGGTSAKLVLWLGVLLMVMGLIPLIAIALDAPDIS